MTIKPSDMAQKLQSVRSDHDAFWEFYGGAVDDIETLYSYYQKRVTNGNTTAAAILTLATMTTPEEMEEEWAP